MKIEVYNHISSMAHDFYFGNKYMKCIIYRNNRIKNIWENDLIWRN